LLNQWESDEDYRVFAEQTFPPALAVGRAPDALIGRAGIQGIPVSVLLDAEQRVVAVHVGNLTGAVVDMLYVLAEPAAGNAAQDAGTGLSTGTATPAGLQSWRKQPGRRIWLAARRRYGPAAGWACRKRSIWPLPWETNCRPLA